MLGGDEQRRFDGEVKRLPLGVGGGEGKGVKGGLLPGRTIRARHDRCDHLDELGEGSAVDPVCVIEQSDQQIAHDHRYGEEARRIEASFLARLVAEHRVSEDRAHELIVDIVDGAPRRVFKL